MVSHCRWCLNTPKASPCSVLGSFVSFMLSSTFQSAFPFPFHCVPFQSDACGQRSLEKGEPSAACLQKSEAKAKENVIYSLYLVKPQCIQISERLFLKWQVVQKLTCSATGLLCNKRCSWIWAVHAMRTSLPVLIFWSWINPLRTLCLQRLLALHNDLTVFAPVSFIFCLFVQYFNGFDFVTFRHLKFYSRWEE